MHNIEIIWHKGNTYKAERDSGFKFKSFEMVCVRNKFIALYNIGLYLLFLVL
jgi:hypothetical protein